jgi:hypothetical protein
LVAARQTAIGSGFWREPSASDAGGSARKPASHGIIYLSLRDKPPSALDSGESPLLLMQEARARESASPLILSSAKKKRTGEPVRFRLLSYG